MDCGLWTVVGLTTEKKCLTEVLVFIKTLFPLLILYSIISFHMLCFFVSIKLDGWKYEPCTLLKKKLPKNNWNLYHLFFFWYASFIGRVSNEVIFKDHDTRLMVYNPISYNQNLLPQINIHTTQWINHLYFHI